MLKLRELIKKVRACKTAEDERCLVNKEMADIRNMSREQTDQLKCRNLAKCIFIHMLGHQTNFIQISCINLLTSSKFSEKRIAYIALCVLLDDSSEVLLLAHNSIKKDLENSNQFVVAIALNSIGEACNADMCRTLSQETLKLMKSPNPYIKKKAALACARIIRKCPDLTDIFIERIHTYLEEKNHGVLICGATLAIQIFKAEPQYIEKFRKHQPTIMKYLRNMVSSSSSPEYDINGVSDPFLQVKLLELLQQFGKNNVEASEEMNDLLASISTNTETNKNTGNAVLYELSRTIINIESNSGLNSLCSTILGRFLTHKDNNYKYIALNTLLTLAATDINSVQKHKTVILECMKDNDISIKRRALDLVYIIINTSNIKQIIKECLNFLIIAENEIKIELTTKINQSLEKYSPSLKWQIDTLIKMLCLAGNFVTDDTISSIINLVINTQLLHVYVVHKLFISVKNNLAQEGLVKVALYAIGELGDLLINNSVQGPDNENVSVSEEELISVLQEIQNKKYTSVQIKEYLLNTNIKLAVKLSGSSLAALRQMIENDNNSIHAEVQQRANEYLVFMGLNNNQLKHKILESIPNSKATKENEVKKDLIVDEYENDAEDIKVTSSQLINNNAPKREQKAQPVQENKNPGGGLLIDLGIFGGDTQKDPVNTQKPQQGIDMSQLNNLFNFGAVTSTPVEEKNNNNNINNLFSNIIDQTPVAQNTQTFNLIETQFNQNVNTTPVNNTNNQLKQVFKNGEITLYSTSVRSDRQLSVTFSLSNNVNKPLGNVKIQYAVPKFVDKTINPPSATNLLALASFGIQQTIVLVNQSDKQIILRLKIIYNYNDKEYTETIQIDDF